MRWLRDLSSFLGALSLPFSVALADEDPTLLKSSVRIIEGVVAADWELRFLAPEHAESLAPDSDIAKTPAIPPRPAEEANSPQQKPPIKVSAPTVRGTRKEPRTPSPPLSPARETQNLPSEKAPAPPHPITTPFPSTSAPKVASPAMRATPKVDKTGEADDDNAEKRKKERREILREERKERDYRNRRIE